MIHIGALGERMRKKNCRIHIGVLGEGMREKKTKDVATATHIGVLEERMREKEEGARDSKNKRPSTPTTRRI